ncbi:MAG TPA: endolytic transglycosylase MltG [Caulobacteraceae bacterium]
MRRPRSRPTRRRSRSVLIVLAGLLLVLIASGIGVFVMPGPAARSGVSTRLVFPTGAGLPGIAKGLERGGVVRSALLFMAGAKLSGASRSLKAGEYDFPNHASMAAVMAQIRDGRIVRHSLTIPEGFSSGQVLAVLRAAPELAGYIAQPPEGAILPETYQVVWGETRAHVLARMRAARDALLARLWAGRRPGLPYRSPDEAVILASIVEKETALTSERPHIAAVFLNRLAKGMRLESDPTVVYGLTGGQPLGHGLRVSELQHQTPYNTYLIAGLPPTAIANPGRAALVAALDPAPSSDLYFVADGTGGHVFSSDIATHLKNVARWRGIEQARNAAAAKAPAP